MTSVSSLLPRVRRIADHYRMHVWNPADREDLAQEAVVGLLEAAARYEPDRGVTLGCYGARRATGACLDHVRVLARHGRESPAPDVQTGRDPWDGRVQDSRSPESRVMLARFRRFLARDGGALGGVESDVLRQRYREGRTVREVAAALGTSPATVVRIERRALDALRQSFLASERAGGGERGRSAPAAPAGKAT